MDNNFIKIFPSLGENFAKMKIQAKKRRFGFLALLLQYMDPAKLRIVSSQENKEDFILADFKKMTSAELTAGLLSPKHLQMLLYLGRVNKLTVS